MCCDYDCGPSVDLTFYCKESAVGVAAYNFASLLDVTELTRVEDCYSSSFVAVRVLCGLFWAGRPEYTSRALPIFGPLALLVLSRAPRLECGKDFVLASVLVEHVAAEFRIVPTLDVLYSYF